MISRQRSSEKINFFEQPKDSNFALLEMQPESQKRS